MIGLTHDELMALHPCEERERAVTQMLGGIEKWDGNKITAQQAVKAGVTLNDLVWVTSVKAKRGSEIERRLRLWMADCAARVVHMYEKQHPTDMRVRDAVVAARKFARGEIGNVSRDAAADAAWVATRDAAADVSRAAARDAAADVAADVAWAAARVAAAAAAADVAWAADVSRAAARDAARAAAADVARVAAAAGAADDAAWVVARAAAWNAEEKWQLERLVAWLSDPEPQDWSLPETVS